MSAADPVLDPLRLRHEAQTAGLSHGEPAPAGGPRVAFQGELGAYSEEAVLRFFGEAAVAVPHRYFRDVGRAVSARLVDFGLLPVENTLAGSVVQSYDVLAAEELVVIGEVIVPIHHCVLGVPGATLEGLTRMLSHPVALAQCGRFLEARPQIEAVAVYDTAGAAKEVARLLDPAVAALAGRGAAARFGLTLLAEHVEDRPDNQTRFLVVAPPDAAGASHTASLPPTSRAPGPWERPPAAPAAPAAPGAPGTPSPASSQRTGRPMKTALVIETENVPGALVRVLLPFAERGVNLSKLESRPADEPWSYRFFLEFEADAQSSEARQALEDAARRATRLRVLGSFPQWVEP